MIPFVIALLVAGVLLVYGEPTPTDQENRNG